MFSSTEASTSQWDNSVFVFPIKAPALMILDEYRAEDRSGFSGSIVSVGMVLATPLPDFEFESLDVLLVGTTDPRPVTLESDPLEEFPLVERESRS
jgi:hypothetical protein